MTVVDAQGKPVEEVPLTREQEVGLLQELTQHPGWQVYANLLRLNWEKTEKLVLNPEYARDHESHTDEFLKGLTRGYQQSYALPEVAAGQYEAKKQQEEALRKKAEADAKAGHGEPGFRPEALPPDYGREGGPGALEPAPEGPNGGEG
jgi:hypothetical protein